MTVMEAVEKREGLWYDTEGQFRFEIIGESDWQIPVCRFDIIDALPLDRKNIKSDLGGKNNEYPNVSCLKNIRRSNASKRINNRIFIIFRLFASNLIENYSKKWYN